jgi:SAM-dependent methyltransferase
MKAYLPERGALAFFGAEADAEFWTGHWDVADLARRVRAVREDAWFVPAVRRHLVPGARVLEGGCGRGELVHALRSQGYDAVGLDFARPVLGAVHAAVPELALVAGDVHRLPFRDGSFDGYVSGGVIEHFWSGYGPILSEMHRVLRPGGHLLLTFPHMSWLRRGKARLGRYPALPREAADGEGFYQFALDEGEVLGALTRLGFEPVERRAVGGLKGFKDEVAPARPLLQPIYDGRAGRRAKQALDAVLSAWAGHMAFQVLRKRDA